MAVEAAYEGHLLHRGRSRILDTGDADLALLAGDRLYALSLATLAEAGRRRRRAELADVIALCARPQAAGDEQLERRRLGGRRHRDRLGARGFAAGRQGGGPRGRPAAIGPLRWPPRRCGDLRARR